MNVLFSTEKQGKERKTKGNQRSHVCFAWEKLFIFGVAGFQLFLNNITPPPPGKKNCTGGVEVRKNS